MTTISILIEDNLQIVKPLAASTDREKLIHFAESHYLNRNMMPLREPGSKVEISDLTTILIRDVELLD